MRRCAAWTVAWPSCCAARHLPSNPRSPLRKRAEQHMLVAQRRRERKGLGRGTRWKGVGAYRRRRRRRRGSERLSATARTRTHNSEQLALSVCSEDEPRQSLPFRGQVDRRSRTSRRSHLDGRGPLRPRSGGRPTLSLKLILCPGRGRYPPVRRHNPRRELGWREPAMRRDDCLGFEVHRSGSCDQRQARLLCGGRAGGAGQPTGTGRRGTTASAPARGWNAVCTPQKGGGGCVVAHRIGAVSRAARAGLLQD